MTQKQIHPDIPTGKAWQEGRRIYVPCGYHSKLNTDLRDLGAHWDANARALWVGSGKKAQVIDLVNAAAERGAQVAQVKAAGHWVTIPYDATTIRDQAKQLGARWDGIRKQWAMPTAEALAVITAAVTDRQAAIDAADRKEAEQAKASERARAAATIEQIIAREGRTTTGETATLTEISTRRMNRAAAEASARGIGSIIRLRDGRRGIITAVKVWFTSEEMASSVCWHPETHDEAHWDLQYTLAIVEPTEQEQTADAAAAAEAADTAEVHDLMESAGKLTGVAGDDAWTVIPADDVAGTITATHGVTEQRGGTLTLTRDGRVFWQHPGYYDDWRRSEGITTDPAVADRVRVILEGGDRVRTRAGVQSHHYTIRVAH